MKLTKLPTNIIPVADKSELNQYSLDRKLTIHTIQFSGSNGQKGQLWYLVKDGETWFGFSEAI